MKPTNIDKKSSGQPDTIDQSLQTPESKMNTVNTSVANALEFINSYVENCNKMKDAVGIIDWVNSNNLTTKVFKAELKKIIDDAYMQDPELGLEVDPIFDAQGNPRKGFEVESFDEISNYLTVRGKDCADFKLTMKIKKENGNWLVDGCGMVNITNDKRANR